MIERKREGSVFTADEVRHFFEGYLREEVTDYKVSVFLMSVFFCGLRL